MIPSFPSVSPECVASGGLTPSVVATVWPANAALEGGVVAPSAAAFAQWLGSSAPVAVASVAVATPRAVSVTLTRLTVTLADSRSADFASVRPATASETPVAPDLANAMPVQDQPDRAEIEAACALLAPLLQLGTPVEPSPSPGPVAGEDVDCAAIAAGDEILPRANAEAESASSISSRGTDSFSAAVPQPAPARAEGRGGEPVRPASSGVPRAERAEGLRTASSHVPVAVSPALADTTVAAPVASVVAPVASPGEPAVSVSPGEADRARVEPDHPLRLSARPHVTGEICRAPGANTNPAAPVVQSAVAVETPEGIQIFASLLPASSATARDGAATPTPSAAPANSSPQAPVTSAASAQAPTSAGADTLAQPSASPVAVVHPQSYAAALRAAAPATEPARRGDAERPAISAAPAVAVASAETTVVSVAEKKSLTPRGTSVKPAATEAGIAVAQEPSAMSSVVIAPNPAAPASAVRAEAIALPVAPTSFPMGETAAPSTGAALAHRAVEAVETVVDAQAAARLEPTPGVALRFRAGHEELAVRIEWRAGQVHTEFRTDSEEWRTAVAHEWRAVTARPDSSLRSAEAVFAPASGTSEGSSSSGFSAHSGQSSSQQQQQSQQQQHAAGREAPEIFGRVGRRFPASPSSVAAPSTVAAPLGAHRLSAVA